MRQGRFRSRKLAVCATRLEWGSIFEGHQFKVRSSLQSSLFKLSLPKHQTVDTATGQR